MALVIFWVLLLAFGVVPGMRLHVDKGLRDDVCATVDCSSGPTKQLIPGDLDQCNNGVYCECTDGVPHREKCPQIWFVKRKLNPDSQDCEVAFDCAKWFREHTTTKSPPTTPEPTTEKSSTAPPTEPPTTEESSTAPPTQPPTTEESSTAPPTQPPTTEESSTDPPTQPPTTEESSTDPPTQPPTTEESSTDPPTQPQTAPPTTTSAPTGDPTPRTSPSKPTPPPPPGTTTDVPFPLTTPSAGSKAYTSLALVSLILIVYIL